MLLFTIVVMGTPLQRVWDAGVATALGTGLTTTVAVMGAPDGQPAAFSEVMVNVTVTGAFVVFVRAPLILPVPLAAMPVTDRVLSLVQLNVAPTPARTMAVTGLPVQMVWAAGVAVVLSVGVNSSAPMSGGVLLACRSISVVMEVRTAPLPLRHQLAPAALLKWRFVADKKTGAKLIEFVLPPNAD